MTECQPVRLLLAILFTFCTAVAFGNEIEGIVVGITDGDTVTLLDSTRTQHKIRLVEIDTPERGQPWGTKARQALADKVFREKVTVKSQGTDRYGRVLGRIYLGGRDINRELVAEGHAWVYRQYMTDRSLLEDEAEAREAGRGLWSLPEAQRVPPWDWRKGGQSQSRPQQADKASKPFTCGSKRYCGEMTSCKEAKYYLNECDLSRLDGDGDGIPCESLCR